MSLRSDDAEASMRKQVSALKRSVLRGGLPEGFSWVVTETEDGGKSLSVVEDSSGKIVLQGF